MYLKTMAPVVRLWRKINRFQIAKRYRKQIYIYTQSEYDSCIADLARS